MYLYVKALHIIFVVTWFAGLFYMVRLFIYNTEASEKPEPDRTVLLTQYRVMIRRLWLIITWPSAILVLIFGPWMAILYGSVPTWLWIKLAFVAGLYGYHWSLHRIYKAQMQGVFRYSSFQLRLWNEASTVLLFAIVFLAVLKTTTGWLWGLGGLACLVGLLMGSAKLYKYFREKKERPRG